MNAKVVDYILVGQGLAGSCLAVHLLQRKKSIAVFSAPALESASRVAAGLFNPVTGKKLSLTWQADTLFPYLHTFYKEVERLTKDQFFFPMPVYRPFISAGEQNEWISKSTESPFASHVEVFNSPTFEEQVANPFGGLLVKQSGYLDTSRFLSAVRAFIQSQGTFIEENLYGNELMVDRDGVEYRGLKANKIIFCEGTSANFNKFFSWLPVEPLKGEVLQLKTDAVVPRIYNRGVYVVPGVWKAGATYNRFDKTAGPTLAAWQELTAGLESLIRFPYQVVEQLWGFRPTVPDRRPILGAHPELSRLVIFNGFGTKGVSLAPYFANHLVCWLENGQPLNNEVDIQRYKSVYWKSARNVI
ncbi:MAG: NAD(P)/FAD-dependent oxidoreductase [Cyclobacteriaceae bacterium]